MKRKTGAILSYLHMIIEVISTLWITPLVIHTLGDAEYGVYKLVASLTSYLLLLDLGLGNSVVRYIAKYNEGNDLDSSRKFVGLCLIFYSIISVILICLGAFMVASFQNVFATGLSAVEVKLSKKLLTLTVLNAAITIGTSVFGNIIIAYSQFSVAKGAAIVQILIRMLLTFAALSLGGDSVSIVLINLLLTIAMRGYYVVYVVCVLKLKPKFKDMDFLFVKEVVSFSAFILLQMVATQVNAHTDQVLLGMLVPMSASLIGIYGIGTQIVQYFQSIGQALGGILMPGVVKLVENKASSEQLQNEMIRIGRYSFAILGIIFVGFLVNGPDFLLLWVGPGYDQSYTVAVLLMLAYLFILTESIGTQILWAKNKHQLQSVMKMLIVLVNVGVSIILIRWNPLIGATVGTFFSLMFGDILVMNLVFRKEIGISLRTYYFGLAKGILPSLLLSAVAGCFMLLLPLPDSLALVLNVGCMTLVYAISMWLFGFNQHEKELLNKLCRMILRTPRNHDAKG